MFGMANGRVLKPLTSQMVAAPIDLSTGRRILKSVDAGSLEMTS